MAYDIPDKIQYKEKIVFGLTLKQLLNALGFAIIALFSFSLPLKGDYHFMPPALICVFGLGFIFLDWEKVAMDRWLYISGIREGGAMDKHVQEFIGIRKIENDVVYLANGQMRAILSITPINFQNMDEGRQKSITLNYRDFLNQLNHPIQILVRTVNVDLGEYFAHHDDRVEKTNNSQLIALYREFKLFEQNYLNENRVKERLYYIIVPYDPSDSFVNRYKDRVEILREKIGQMLSPQRAELATMEDEARCKELSDRTTIIQQKLAESSIISRRMATNELISLFMSYFDGYAEVDEDYLSRVVVAKKFFEDKGGDEFEEEEIKATKAK